MNYAQPMFLIGTIFGLTVGFGIQQWRIWRLGALRRAERKTFSKAIEALQGDFDRLMVRYARLSETGRTRRIEPITDLPSLPIARHLPKADGYIGAGRPVIGKPPAPSSVMGERPSSVDDSFMLGAMVGSIIAAEPSKAMSDKSVTVDVRNSEPPAAPSYDSGNSDSGSSISGSDGDSSGGGGE